VFLTLQELAYLLLKSQTFFWFCWKMNQSFKVSAWCTFLWIIYILIVFFCSCRPCWQRIEPVHTATRCLTTRCCAASTTSTTFASQPRSRSVTCARKYSSQVGWRNVENEMLLHLQEKFAKSSLLRKYLGFLRKMVAKICESLVTSRVADPVSEAHILRKLFFVSVYGNATLF
jgi:hypothetical protein